MKIKLSFYSVIPPLILSRSDEKKYCLTWCKIAYHSWSSTLTLCGYYNTYPIYEWNNSLADHGILVTVTEIIIACRISKSECVFWLDVPVKPRWQTQGHSNAVCEFALCSQIIPHPTTCNCSCSLEGHGIFNYKYNGFKMQRKSIKYKCSNHRTKLCGRHLEGHQSRWKSIDLLSQSFFAR